MLPQTSKKIRVIAMIGTLSIGGSESQLCEIFSRLNRERFEPSVYCLDAGGPLSRILAQHNIPVTVAALPPYAKHRGLLKKMATIRALYAHFHHVQPDIAHGFLYHASLYGGIAARLAGVPALITNRMSLGYFKDQFPGYQFAENLLNRATDIVMVKSLAIQRDALARERLAPDKIRMIYGGVDLSKFAPPSSAEHFERQRQQKKRWGIPEKNRVIGMVANLRSCKGYVEYVTAAAEVIKQHTDVTFLCIGEDRGLRGELERMAAAFGIAGHLLFTGVIEKMPAVYPLLDIVVSASHEEGFSNAILEAMACEKAIVATTVGGTPEQIIDQQSGLLIPPRDAPALARAISLLLEHPDIARTFGVNARKRVETHFTIEQTVRGIEELYDECSERTRSRQNSRRVHSANA